MSETAQDSSGPLYYILERLKDLSTKFDVIQRDITAMQSSLVSRSELKELRDHFDRDLNAERERCNKEFQAERAERVAENKEIGGKLTDLRVQSGIAAFVIAALTAWAVRKLGG